ncbi:MAG: acyl-CoA dehydrogenase family protein, partial [Deferribacterales bacterium]
MLKGSEFLIKSDDVTNVFTPEDFSDEQKQMAETTEKFITEKAIPFIEEIDGGNYDKVVELMKEAGELGLLMIDGPEEYGGLNLDKATSMLVAEKVAPAGSFSVA